jgi:hypothetical protein
MSVTNVRGHLTYQTYPVAEIVASESVVLLYIFKGLYSTYGPLVLFAVCDFLVVISEYMSLGHLRTLN